MANWEVIETEELFDKIYNIIIEKLKNNKIPWKESWTIDPVNLFSNRHYNGINIFLLNLSGYDSPYWLTENQIAKLKGRIKKGEIPTPVILYFEVKNQKFDIENKEEEPNNKLLENEIAFREVKYSYKIYRVYNFEETENINHKIRPHKNFEIESQEKAQEIINNYTNKPIIHNYEGEPYYNPNEDKILIPNKMKFNDWREYFSTFFHELIHSTGHNSRLNRISSVNSISWDDHKYSKEELIAEFGSSFLCGYAGFKKVKNISNSAAYIKFWLGKLSVNKDWCFFAAAQARKAVNHILKNSTLSYKKIVTRKPGWIEEIDDTA